ncbi:MAG: hypothetical protein WKF58_18150 [Ilumatobacteraceae bacterium]
MATWPAMSDVPPPPDRLYTADDLYAGWDAGRPDVDGAHVRLRDVPHGPHPGHTDAVDARGGRGEGRSRRLGDVAARRGHPRRPARCDHGRSRPHPKLERVRDDRRAVAPAGGQRVHDAVGRRSRRWRQRISAPGAPAATSRSTTRWP